MWLNVVGESNGSQGTGPLRDMLQHEDWKDEKFLSVKNFYIWSRNGGGTDGVIVILQE